MNFALIMLIALAITGAIWLLDIWVLKARRPKDKAEPIIIEYAKSFFPVILIVFLLRSFLVEPFKIPSGSMIPTLLVGDFILVNKYVYGIRLPVVNTKIIDIEQPKRGDVIVFRYPIDKSVDYIKRLVGLPGDKISYVNKRLTVNGVPVETTLKGDFSYIRAGLNYVTAQQYQEKLGDTPHNLLIHPSAPNIRLDDIRSFSYRQNCTYNDNGFTCEVPAGYYFLMGDNRDDSNDSRYWGFVPDSHIVGKAFLIWWNFDNFKRIGHIIN